MIWKKKKDAAAQSAEAAGEMTGAKGRTGAGAFAKKNWKWLVPLVVVAAAGAVFLIGGGRNGAASRDVTYAETTPVRQDAVSYTHPLCIRDSTISYHGHGAIENIVPELTARGYKKAFVCSDPDLLKFGVTKKVTDLLDAANFAYTVYSEIKPNPTIANVQDLSLIHI